MYERLEAQKPQGKMHAPFFKLLQKPQVTTFYTSYSGNEENYNDDGVLKQLQYYVKASNEAAYNELVKKLPHRMFRRTKGEVYEMRDEGEKIEIRIALQVKSHSLTWYFWKPGAMDQYPQEFRDILYNSAAQAHREVENGCDLYYRGSNSVHVKLMHHLESESGHNHNHYRLKNNQMYTPYDFNQHLNALKKTEAYAQFFNEDEIEQLQEDFAAFYTKWYAKIEDGFSKHEEYLAHPSQQLNSGDVIELMLFGHQQEPCRISVDELNVDYEAARLKIELALKGGDSGELEEKLREIEKQYFDLLKYREKGGSRGLFSEIASTRQTYQSDLQPIPHVGGQDGSFGLPPEIPEWAYKLRLLVEEGKKAAIETRAEKEIIAESQTEIAIQKFEKEIPEHVRNLNMQKNITFFSNTGERNDAIEDTQKESVENKSAKKS